MSKKKKHSFKRAIMYLSDLFVMTMVLAWIVSILLMSGCAIYALIQYADTSIFSNLAELVLAPVTAGGAIWLIRCCLQHYKIITKTGEQVSPDFPNEENEG